MCNCPNEVAQQPGVFYCKRYKLFATERLNVCILTEIQQAWDTRLQHVPPIVKAMAGMDHAVDCIDEFEVRSCRRNH